MIALLALTRSAGLPDYSIPPFAILGVGLAEPEPDDLLLLGIRSKFHCHDIPLPT